VSDSEQTNIGTGLLGTRW